MPVMDGWEATRALKADPNLRTICIVALSGFPAERAEATALLAGCDRYVMKPCSPVDLARVIQDVLQIKRAS